jgi:hypothetical protein
MQVILQRKPDAHYPEFYDRICVAGETVFYNSNILHCATYDSKHRRATLHASMGDTRGGSSRARNVLQHGLDWMREDRFRLSLDGKSRPMLDRLLAMYNSAADVGYSQLG